MIDIVFVVAVLLLYDMVFSVHHHNMGCREKGLSLPCIYYACDVYYMLACWIPPPSNLIVVNLFCDVTCGIHGHEEGSSLPLSVCGK